MPSLKAYGHRAIAGLILLFVLPSPLWAAGRNPDIQPEVVTISSFFSGVQMHITYDLPPNSQAVLSVRGKRIEEELMRKSHRWELWMNRGEVDIDNAPMLYIALSSDPRLLSRDRGEFPWGYNALEKEAEFSGSLKPSEDDIIFNEFVQLKERDKLYHLYPGGLKISQISPDQWQAMADFHLPSRVKPGTHHITLWIVRNGAVIDRLDDSFEVRQQGMPELLHSLAMKHGIFYGFMAVVIAMTVGLLTGFASRRRGGGH
jgi:hypothetical protein